MQLWHLLEFPYEMKLKKKRCAFNIVTKVKYIALSLSGQCIFFHSLSVSTLASAKTEKKTFVHDKIEISKKRKKYIIITTTTIQLTNSWLSITTIFHISYTVHNWKVQSQGKNIERRAKKKKIENLEKT